MVKSNSYIHGYATRKNKNHFYKLWEYMKSRCNNPNNSCYKNYGRRGIKVCNKWENDPVTFIKWCSDKYKKGLVIDRINNNGNYNKGNCKWATRKEQQRNRNL